MRKISITLILLSFFVIGCTDDSRPKDLPLLYSCVIFITQDGMPLAGAVVDLVAVDQANAKYQASTVTDETGKAVLTTYGYDGVPAGKYRVCVWKTLTEDVKEYINRDGESVETLGTEYRTVETQYSSADTTPHEIEITGKKMPPITFDVGKPVKIKK